MDDSPHEDEVVVSDGQIDPSLDTTKTTPEDATSTNDGASTDTAAEESGKDKSVDTPAKFDDDLDEWAEKTGRGKPETDRERKLMQDVRNNHRASRAEMEAKKTVDGLNKATKAAAPESEVDEEDDPLVKDVNALKTQLHEEKVLRQRGEYVTENNVTAEEAKVMGEILAEKAEKGGQKAYDFWTDPANLEDWHTLAKARLAKATDNSEVAEQAAQAERERLAKLSKAGGTQKSASTTKSVEEKTRTDVLNERWSSKK